MGVQGKVRRGGMVIPLQRVATTPCDARTAQSAPLRILTKLVSTQVMKNFIGTMMLNNRRSGQLPFLGSCA